VHAARTVEDLETAMHRALTMTTSQARETIDRLSEETASMRRHGAAPEAMIADYNDSLTAFVPRDKMPHFYIGKGRYVGDTTRPGAFVQAGFFRHLIETARSDFASLLLEMQQQTPKSVP
jgi:hypothetical protein